ncbi:Intraflagellar transport protein IFT56 [Giardia muris]|uniref:Intraflagellar transport protein 56 n=1 Tax=Giardia muris TaxID=5742 RepID=A0A4Z1T8N0_GIAMU|nr:Intraflagellar transport protein IFT56 [Giardia muris]|eukprot:TNJ29487.1 Intraflagellar transport protein IFT56 [Giardia muris]
MLHNRMTTAFERSKEVELEAAKNEVPSFQTFIERRDFVGAYTVLRFQRAIQQETAGTIDLWIAYCCFHMGKHEEALEIYTRLKEASSPVLDLNTLDLYRAICMLYIGQMSDARELASRLPPTPLSNRLLFHACSRLLDEEALVTYHTKLRNVSADQMALAAVHFLRTHYQQALECYEEVLTTQPECYAIYMHMALCYYKLGDYAKSEDCLVTYRENAEDSFASLNLLAATKFRQGKPEEAMSILENLTGDPMIEALPLFKHNTCLYSNLNAAVHILPPLVGVVPEARQNLVKLYIEKGLYEEAYKVVQNFEPAVSAEYTLKAAAFAYYGQAVQDMSVLQYAQAAYSTVGQSDADRDTLLGRRAMAAAFFLTGEFEDAAMYLESIADIIKESEDSFTLNYALCLAATCKVTEALERLMTVLDSPNFTAVHRTWLGRLLIRSQRSAEALELFQEAERNSLQTILLLKVIANECFAAGEYQYAERAAAILVDLDKDNKAQYLVIQKACIAAMELKRRGRDIQPPELVYEAE